jgi:hypothetical protein
MAVHWRSGVVSALVPASSGVIPLQTTSIVVDGVGDRRATRNPIFKASVVSGSLESRLETLVSPDEEL